MELPLYEFHHHHHMGFQSSRLLPRFVYRKGVWCRVFEIVSKCDENVSDPERQDWTTSQSRQCHTAIFEIQYRRFPPSLLRFVSTTIVVVVVVVFNSYDDDEQERWWWWSWWWLLVQIIEWEKVNDDDEGRTTRNEHPWISGCSFCNRNNNNFKSLILSL